MNTDTDSIIRDMERQLRLVMRLAKELHDSPQSLLSNLREGSAYIEETLAKLAKMREETPKAADVEEVWTKIHRNHIDTVGMLGQLAKDDPTAFVKAADTTRWGQLYRVCLLDCGRNKIHCIKVVRELTGQGLADAKHFCENPPQTAIRSVNFDRAQQVVEKFREVGATAKLYPMDGP
jgi:ribosomal protein L7/L12